MRLKNQKIIVIGCGGHARFVLSLLNSSEYEVEGLIDLTPDFDASEIIMQYPVIGGISDLSYYRKQGICNAVLAIGDNNLRTDLYTELLDLNYELPNIVHATSVIDNSVNIGNGNIIGPSTILGAEVIIGNNNIINSGAIIEHRSNIGNHCHLAPSSTLCGQVMIGDNVLLGAGCTIIPNVKIDNNCTVGAGSTVIRNSNKPGIKLVGIPAREISS